MKTKYLLLLPILLLTACSEGLSTTTSSDSTSLSTSTSSDTTISSSISSVEDSSSSVEEENSLETALEKAKNDITISGTSNKIRTFKNPYYISGNTDYDSEDLITFGSRAYDRLSTREDGETTDITYYKDEEGFLCEEYLTYKNEIGLVPVTDSLGNRTLFADSYSNPFLNLQVEDFEQVDESTYKISGDDSSVFMSHLLQEEVRGDIYFTLVDEDITTIYADNLQGTENYVSTSTYTKVDVTLSFEYTLSTDKVNIIENTITPSTDSYPELDALFSNLTSFRFNNLMDGEVTMSTYFDGENALYQMMMPGADYANYFDMYFVQNDEGICDLYWANMSEDDGSIYFEPNDPSYTEMYQVSYTYQELMSDIKSLSSAVFTKDESSNQYIAKEETLPLIGENIIPAVYDSLGLTSYDELRYAADSLIITIVDDSTFNMDVKAVIANGGVSSTITASFQFTDIGDCKLPYTPEI